MNLVGSQSIFERGAWYVIIQVILIGLILFGPRGFLLIENQTALLALYSVGIGVALLSLVIMPIAAINLGKNLTPLPCPRDDAQFVQSGLYRFVRHPLYFGVILAAVAWLCLFPNIFILAYVIGLGVLFDIKARREELWLIDRFPAYASYKASTKKLIPYLY
ncbi:methyltransferase family protein [Polynucleobacter brandtiae]|uniref:Protein-S-isoprenylcysteine O-methyltransferase Ste14 n=1 Tax=Polynucleobacter brandtiae TaxID=1938816 RepID=A0A2M8VZ20_9BURK|nr:isoprenylcysteine carboxylmethyltransferase family protein [Polynucleobacter brandtiae]PJI83099.1 protein-S-isoprenylcysteine O-methyltransferase Ste14 [Polynucleobacter brandtiae]